MSRLYLVRSVTVHSLSVLSHPLLLRAGQSTQGCGKEISDPYLNSINPYGSFKRFTLPQAGQGKLGLRSHVNVAEL